MASEQKKGGGQRPPPLVSRKSENQVPGDLGQAVDPAHGHGVLQLAFELLGEHLDPLSPRRRTRR